MVSNYTQEDLEECSEDFEIIKTGSSSEKFQSIQSFIEPKISTENEIKITYPDIKLDNIYEIDQSSLYPVFSPKSSNMVSEILKRKRHKFLNVEVEYDFYMKIPPKEKFKINLHISKIKKGIPKMFPEDFKFFVEEKEE